MKTRKHGTKREHGAITVMTAFVLTALIGFTALAVDLGMYHYKGAKLQNAVDAAATAVAGNLGTVDTSLEEIAYQYLAENGFDKDAYGKDSNQKNNLQVKIQKKGVANLESADDEKYITTGYYKVTVSTNESTLFGKIFNIDKLRLSKCAYVRAEANYVDMPRALNYTIFAGSTKGTSSSPAIRIDGRTNKTFNMVTYFAERGINFINSNVVQPIIGFFGGNPNYGDLVRINLSEIVSNGDVHSNSNIGVGVQALNVSRIKDKDYEGDKTVEAYSEIEVEDTDFERGFNDYGQVTFTAVKDIRFNYLSNYADGQTRVYVPNQQYIEQTQVALDVIDLISDFDSITSEEMLKSKYEEAATVYLEKQFNLTDEQRTAIANQKDNLEFIQRGEYRLRNQGGIQYYIHSSSANDFLGYAKEKGVDQLITDIETSGNDKMFNGNPEDIVNGTKYDNSIDKSESKTSTINFTKKNSDKSVRQSAKLYISGNDVGRDYGKITGNHPETKNGVRFATAQTFQENSEYIEIPNLKPYFSRQINRSVRNATKSREQINQSDAGQKNVKAAVKSKNDELIGLVRDLSFEDNTYANSEEYDDYDKTVLFKTYKASPSSGLTYLKDNSVTYTGKSQDTDNNSTYSYTVTMTDKTFKGYSLYDSNNNLKKPSEFTAEKKTMMTQVNRFGANAITDKYNEITDSAHSGANSEKTAVSRKKTELQNNLAFNYNYEKNDSDNDSDVKDRIESQTVPNITQDEITVTPLVTTVTPPAQTACFLVKGNSNYTATQRYNNAMDAWGVKTSSNANNTNNIKTFGVWGWNSNYSSSDTKQTDITINYNTTANDFINAIYNYRSSWNTGSGGGTDSSNKFIRCKNDGTINSFGALETGERSGDYHKIIEPGDGSKTKERYFSWGYKERNEISFASGDDFYSWGEFAWGHGVYVGKSMRLRTTGCLNTQDGKALVLAQYAGVLVTGTDSSGYALKVDNNMDMGSDSFAALKGNVKLGVASKGEGKLTMPDGAIMLVDGSLEAKGTITMNSNNVLIVDGDLTCSSISLGANCTLVVRGTLTTSNHLTVPASTTVTANNITISGDGHRIECSGKIIATGNVTVNDGHDWFSLLLHDQAQMYVGGNLTCNQRITLDGFTYNNTECRLYVCGNVQAGNTTSDSGSGNDALWVMNDSKVYIGGTFSTTAADADRRIWISPWTNGNNNVTSGQQNAVVSIRGGLSNIDGFYNEQSGGVAYFGSNGLTTTTAANNFNNYGSIYSFGNINIASNTVTLQNNGVTYCNGNFTATNGSVTISNNHTLYAQATKNAQGAITSGGQVVVKDLTLNDSAKVHGDDKVQVTGVLTLNGSSTIVEGIASGISYGSTGTINGNVNGKISFAVSTISYSNLGTYGVNPLKGFVYTPTGGSVTYSSFKLTHSIVKIDGNVVVNGNLELTSSGYPGGEQCILYITGNLTVKGNIKLDYANLYVEKDIKVQSGGNIEAKDWSVLLARNGDEVNTLWTGDIFVSDVTVAGTVLADAGSKVYVEGTLSTKGANAKDGGQILAYKALNITATLDYSSDTYNAGFLLVNGNNSEVFCGEQSSTSREIGIIGKNGTGSIYYPNTALSCIKIDLSGGAKFVMDGAQDVQNLTVKTNNPSIGSGGIFFNRGRTKAESCHFINSGMMYLLGGIDLSAAGTGTNGIDFEFGNGSVSYIGKAKDDNATGNSPRTLETNGYYLGRGTVYIENNLNVKGYGDYKVQKDMPSSNDSNNGKRNTCICVFNGTTYVEGSVTASDGNAIWTEPGCKLIMNNNFNVGCAICNYGTIHVIDGNLVVNSSDSCMWRTVGDLYDYTLGVKTSEKFANNYKNDSLINGYTEDDNSAEFFVGGTSPITFIGTVKNYGSMYLNSPLDTRGYDQLDEVSDDVAFLNYCGGQVHINGNVKLNGNQLFNKWRKGTRDCVFACEGNLTYGSCLYNQGKLYAGGNITNRETSSTSMRDPVYRNDKHFSVMNGFHRVDDTVRHAISDYVHPEAELYCDGNLIVGDQEDDGDNYGKAGSVINGGKMYVKKNFTIWTNGTRYQGDGAAFWKNAAPAYFRTGLWLFNNSDTFVGGDTFVGAGCAFGRDTIFMTGGEFRTKRATKLNAEMRIDWFLGLDGYMTYTDDSTNYSNGDRYNSAYIYVGGDAFINTLGSTVISRTWATLVGAGRWPANNSRDTDIYANTNMYVGGSLYCSSKMYLKENVNIMVAGKDSIVDVEGNTKKLGFFNNTNGIKSTLYNTTEGVPTDINTRARTVLYLNNNKNCKFFAYQHLDMYPCSKLIVKGGGHVDDTVKIRDMTKTYFYGNFEGKEYVELGKSLDGADETEAKETGFIRPGENLTTYEFENAPYMYVGGNFESGDQNGVTGVFQWIKNQFASTGYTKVFASATLKVKGTVVSNRYITLRHDARIFAGGDLTAATSIEGGNYSEFYVGGDMTAGSSGFTKIIDTLDILDISSRGTIDLRDQCQCIVGGSMFSTKHIQIGELATGSYTRGRKTNYAVKTVTEGGENAYESPDDEDTTEVMCPECGEVLTDDEISNRHCDDCNKDIDINASGDGDGTSEGMDDTPSPTTSSLLGDDNVCPSCGKKLSRRELKANKCGTCGKDLELPYGANVFVQGTLIALNGHFKEFAYSSVMVGKYVYAPDYITLRSNADLWVMPEMFGNDTYRYLPYVGATPTNLWERISEWFKEMAYEFNEKYKPKEGSIYTLGDVTANTNSSIMGTYDCFVPGKLIMRYDSLIYFGNDVSCYASTALSAAGGAIGNLKNLFTGSSDRQTYTGFDAVGEADQGFRYTCKNYTAHDGYYYNMTFRSDDSDYDEDNLYCDVCHQKISKTTKKKVQVSYPAVIYAFNDINIATTVDMQMTYLVADRGDVNLTNVYTATNWNETNLKELPNAIASYQGNINYFAMYGKLASLFYAPSNRTIQVDGKEKQCGVIDFDGYYSEIWGCVLGDTVKMNCYYQAFHRFNNWRTMDLQIAESGSVYIIPEKDYNKAADKIDDDNYIDNDVTSPVELFFSACKYCKKTNWDTNNDAICDYCHQKSNICPSCKTRYFDYDDDGVCNYCGYDCTEASSISLP